MFTIVQAVPTSKTNWKRSYECETSVTIVRMSCDNVAINKKHEELNNRIYSYIFIYNHIFMYDKCKFNVDLY